MLFFAIFHRKDTQKNFLFFHFKEFFYSRGWGYLVTDGIVFTSLTSFQKFRRIDEKCNTHFYTDTLWNLLLWNNFFLFFYLHTNYFFFYLYFLRCSARRVFLYIFSHFLAKIYYLLIFLFLYNEILFAGYTILQISLDFNFFYNKKNFNLKLNFFLIFFLKHLMRRGNKKIFYIIFFRWDFFVFVLKKIYSIFFCYFF